MIIVKKKKFWLGALMALVFFGILACMFMPWFGGQNAFRAADQLFNTISKGSTWYVPGLRKKAAKYEGKTVELKLKFQDEKIAGNAKTLLTRAGLEVSGGKTATAKGDLGKLLMAALKDSDDMFHNKGKAVSDRYGIKEKLAMYAWWIVFQESMRSLKSQKKFKEAAFLDRVQKRAVEVGYNYYKVAPKKASAKAGILIFALVFYVFYTLWWGFAIFYMAEGIGLQLKAGKKKEV